MGSPAIVLVSKFLPSSAKKFSSYINYIDREDAKRNYTFSTYSLYNDYMGNPQKTTSLFNNKTDCMSEPEKKNSKELFRKAQENDSIMWQDVFSFDNKWLENQGLFNTRTKELDEKKLKNAVRESINYCLDKQGINESATWNGAIHYNTDNIHVHVAICEPNPTTKRGKKTQKTLDTMKSKLVNELLDNNEYYKEINKSIRENLVQPSKEFSIESDKYMKELMIKAIENLPTDKKQWKYGYNTMKDTNKYLDMMTDHYIKTYKKDEFDDLVSKLDEHEKALKEIYGVGSREKYKDYKQNKLDDLYKRMGNSMIPEIKEFIKKENVLSNNSINKINFEKIFNEEPIQQNKYINDAKNNMENKSDLDSIVKNKFKKRTHNRKVILSKKDMNKIKKALGNEFDNIKNVNYYEKLQHKIDNNFKL